MSIRVINKKGNVKFVSKEVANSVYMEQMGYRIEDLNVTHSEDKQDILLDSLEKESEELGEDLSEGLDDLEELEEQASSVEPKRRGRKPKQQ